MSINILNEKSEIYFGITSYIGDVVLTLIKKIPAIRNSPSYSLYYAKIGCLLCIEDRYIICVIEEDPYPIGHQEYLSNLSWVSFQTRTITQPPDNLNLRIQESKSKGLNFIVNDKILLQEKTNDKCIYLSQTLPLKVELLFTEHDDSYASTGTIQSALDTYNCVLSFTI